MDEMIRDAMHNALDREPTPAGLRWRVIDAVPMPRAGRLTLPRLSLQWSAGLIAVGLALAIVAGMIYWRDWSRSQVSPVPQPSSNALVSPEGLTVAPDGTVYVSDFVTGEVFRLEPGRLALIAGGASGTGGADSRVVPHRTAGLAADRNGRLYVAEMYAGRFVSGNTLPGDVLRIDPSGAIFRFVPGAGLSDPVGLALDGGGMIYFSDFNGNVGAMDQQGNVIWVQAPIAGGPAVNPGYIAFDAAGSLYISDRAPLEAGWSGACRIIRMSPDKKFSVVAGTGVCGFSGDGGPATKAQINDPNGIAFDSEGNLYFADANNHRVRRIDRSGVITTIAGTGQVGTSGDGGAAKAARLSYPFGIGIAPGNLLYIADASCPCESAPPVAGRIRVVNLATGGITTVADGATPVVTTG